MLAACEAALPADIAVMAAAVADWRVAREADAEAQEGARRAAARRWRWRSTPTSWRPVAAHATQRPRLVVGFAAETEKRGGARARPSALRKGCDWIVANDVSGDVMGGARNAVHLVTAAGVEDWPRLPKEEVARRLAARIARALGFTPPGADRTPPA